MKTKRIEVSWTCGNSSVKLLYPPAIELSALKEIIESGIRAYAEINKVSEDDVEVTVNAIMTK